MRFWGGGIGDKSTREATDQFLQDHDVLDLIDDEPSETESHLDFDHEEDDMEGNSSAGGDEDQEDWMDDDDDEEDDYGYGLVATTFTINLWQLSKSHCDQCHGFLWKAFH